MPLQERAKEMSGSMRNATGTKIGEFKARTEDALRRTKAKLKKAGVWTRENCSSFGRASPSGGIDGNLHAGPFGRRRYGTDSLSDQSLIELGRVVKVPEYRTETSLLHHQSLEIIPYRSAIDTAFSAFSNRDISARPEKLENISNNIFGK